MKFLRMRPGTASSSSPRATSRSPSDEERLVEEFRRQLDAGHVGGRPGRRAATGRREAEMVHAFDEIPRDADRVIFFPRAAGGAR